MDLSLERWNALTDAERHAAVAKLQLPSGFEPRGFLDAIAQFTFRGQLFSLVPGGAVSLGFDVGRWEPNAEEAESYSRSQEEYGLPPLQELLAECTRRQRIVTLPALLVQVVADEAGWETLAVDDPTVSAALDEMPRQDSGKSMLISGDARIEVTFEQSRVVRARRASGAGHGAITAALQRDGFRLPTSDEWELLCGAGAKTLYRWGDHAPCDRYPTDLSPAEAAWRHQWALSGGTLERPKQPFADEWNLHRVPNAFGLRIASDPYWSELVAEAGVTRGGDGGSSICGGSGFLMGWMPLATAWFVDDFCRADPQQPVMAGYTVVRRVLPL
jgi:hypothetical protein